MDHETSLLTTKIVLGSLKESTDQKVRIYFWEGHNKEASHKYTVILGSAQWGKTSEWALAMDVEAGRQQQFIRVDDEQAMNKRMVSVDYKKSLWT